MNTETLLKVSIIQAQLMKLAADLDGNTAKILKQAAALLSLVRGAVDLRDPDKTRARKHLRLV